MSTANPVWSRNFYSLPSMGPQNEYGNILINRVADGEKVLPVTFSHWTHRINYTCEVCHTELEFSMKSNSSKISHDEQQNDRYCGACHDGATTFSFSHRETCINCHNEGNVSLNINDKIVSSKKMPFPATAYGNGIDWVQALQRGLITPRRYLKDESYKMAFERKLNLEAEASLIPPSSFPHKVHLEWMGCDMCHPTLFNIKKKGTENFGMNAILEGKFCGACHLKIAFPIDNCKRCHPEMRGY